MRAWPILLLIAACGPAGLPNEVLVYVRDAHGSVAAAVDQTGAKVWETHDDAYGLRLAYSGTPVPRELLDQPLDEETGFYQFHYRAYDPATAQWLQPDPRLQQEPDACASQPEYCDPYAYAGDRPGEWIDPDGRWVQNNVMIGGELYTVMTVAFIGPDAQRVADATAKAIAESNAVPGNRKILMAYGVYASESDAPKSYTRVEQDFGVRGPSQTDSSTSTVSLREDAAEHPDKLGVITLHEIEHTAGAGDGYRAGHDAEGNRTTTPEPGREDDIMATLEGKTVSAIDVQQMTDAQARGELNQGREVPGPGEWPYATDPTDTSPYPARVEYQ